MQAIRTPADFASAKPTGVYQADTGEESKSGETKSGPMDLLHKLRERNARA